MPRSPAARAGASVQPNEAVNAASLRAAYPVWLARRAAQLAGLARDASAEPLDAVRAERLSALADAIGRELMGEGDARLHAEHAQLLRVEGRLVEERAEALLARAGRSPEDVRRAEGWLAFARIFRELHTAVEARLAAAPPRDRPESRVVPDALVGRARAPRLRAPCGPRGR